MTEEDRKYQRVILLDPPPTAQNLTVTLPDGTTFRPMDLMVCPVCLCPTCAGKPPKDYRRKLRVALGRFPWSGEGEVEAVDFDS